VAVSVYEAHSQDRSVFNNESRTLLMMLHPVRRKISAEAGAGRVTYALVADGQSLATRVLNSRRTVYQYRMLTDWECIRLATALGFAANSGT
jgi:hypothetical protein